MTVFMFAIAFPYDHCIKPDNRIGFVVMYSLTFFFANFGPNATTFIVPAEIFPARLRSTCHGISAATGKAGAIVGAFGFLYAAQPQDKTKTDAGYPPGIGVKNSLIMLGVINFVGMLFTFLVPEPKGKSLEELSGETELDMANEGQISILRALDSAKTQWYHVTTVIISGMGFFTDSYDLFVISLITKLLGRIYYQKPGSSSPGSLPDGISATVSGVAFAGTFLGQIFFGCLGDKLGRKRVYGLTLVIMTVCSICSGLSLGTDPKSVMTTLCFFRFWLGFGIGGDYPLSATIMSEYANKRTRGAFIASVFAMQGVGILAAGGVSLLVSYIFELHFPSPAYMVDPATSTVPQADYVWRIILMLGAIPALLTYYWRVKMPETARYTSLVAKKSEQAASDMAKVLNVDIEASSAKHDQARFSSDEFGLFSAKFLRRHGLHLLATTTTWFLLDIAFYSQNLFQKDIFTTIGWLPPPKTMNAIQELFMISKAQFLIALCGTVPGYIVTIATIDWMGRFKIQVVGFFMMMLCLIGLALPYHHWTLPHNRIGFIVLYSLTFFFCNFGPNATTFIVPAEIFPARLRSSCHGISAASGKAGAMVGSFGFAALVKALGMRNTLLVMAGISLVGMLLTLFLVPEPKGKSLEDLSGEAEPEKIKDTIVV
ncbi:unnamed protein product [Brassica oleracea var. botrytis]